MVQFTPDADTVEPPVEILLVEHDQQQVDLALDVIQSHHLANRIHVLRDGAEALDFLFRSGDYANRHPASPRLVLFHLRLVESADIEVLRRIKRDPRTSAIPLTVLASSTDDRLAAMSELHEYDLQLPVVVIARPTPEETVRALSSIGRGPSDAQFVQDDVVSVVGGTDEMTAPQPDGAHTPPGAPATFDNLCLERDLETLMRVARGAAHEFNNLFSVIVAYTELLLKDVDLDDPRRAGAEEIFRSIGRASKLTRQLLTFCPTAARTPEDAAPARPGPRPVKRPNRAGVS